MVSKTDFEIGSSQKISNQPFDPKKTQVKQNSGANSIVMLFYGSLSYDSLWTITVEIDSEGKVIKTKADLQGYE
jgi:hypothetical protein